MSDLTDTLLLALVAKIKDDPQLLAMVLDKTHDTSQPNASRALSHEPPCGSSSSSRVEPRGRSIAHKRSLSTALTVIIDDAEKDPSKTDKDSSASPGTKSSLQPKSKKPQLHTEDRSPSPSHQRKRRRYESDSASSPEHTHSSPCLSPKPKKKDKQTTRKPSPPHSHSPPPLSPSAKRSSSPPPKHGADPTDTLPEPPEGWMDNDYYDRMYSSYYQGGKTRGGRKFKMVNGQATKEIEHSFLEKLGTIEPRKLRIPHFNPYGHVPRDPKAVARIDRPVSDDWMLYVEVGSVGDYDWYLDAMSIIRSVINEFKPDDSVLKEGETCVTWRHFSASVYKAIPWMYHFRDQTNKDCWVVAEIARNYLSGSKSYDSKRKHIKVPNKLMRRNATKLAENAAKRFPVPAKEDDPYYITSAAAGKFNFESAKEQRQPLTADRTDRTSSSTSKRQARRADKIAAQEECNNALKTQLDKTSKRPRGIVGTK
ncbi:hypothetical protein BN14_05445 [Rhizoctonia solani AG-1 IB]|uniref:Uncharacterized protein n=1 Tax=Thanatephorus cucumeris (strain AG1-IB / isolate 7/3/14) TaxID=1108050 RepID=M5BVZ7_THACB|nr:hypothetical protein BN14_05445 [Rhizoctonia solani AG-1 IB]